MSAKQKPKTQTQALLELLKKGKPTNWIKAFQLTGSTKLSTRVSDFIKLGFVFKKERVNFTTRYGTRGQHIEYTMDLKKTPKKLLINK